MRGFLSLGRSPRRRRSLDGRGCSLQRDQWAKALRPGERGRLGDGDGCRAGVREPQLSYLLLWPVSPPTMVTTSPTLARPRAEHPTLDAFRPHGAQRVGPTAQKAGLSEALSHSALQLGAHSQGLNPGPPLPHPARTPTTNNAFYPRPGIHKEHAEVKTESGFLGTSPGPLQPCDPERAALPQFPYL